MEVDYYSKYLKYKSKYLELKKQFGGDGHGPCFAINDDGTKCTCQKFKLEEDPDKKKTTSRGRKGNRSYYYSCECTHFTFNHEMTQEEIDFERNW